VGFSNLALEQIANPRNAGPLEGATHKGVAGDPGGGPYVILWTIVEGDRILKASYECNGCPASIASSGVAAQILCGRTVEQALSITAQDLTLIVGELPPGKEYCPRLVVEAIAAALRKEGDHD